MDVAPVSLPAMASQATEPFRPPLPIERLGFKPQDPITLLFEKEVKKHVVDNNIDFILETGGKKGQASGEVRALVQTFIQKNGEKFWGTAALEDRSSRAASAPCIEDENGRQT